jgi:ferredoxin
MATMITAECINCGACEPECPNTAIYQGGVEWEMNGVKHPPLAQDVFYIVPEKCTECVGFYDHEACAAVCPVDVCIPNPQIPESEEVLILRAKELHPDVQFAPDFPSRFHPGRGEGAAPAAPADAVAAPAVAPAAPAPAAATPARPAVPGVRVERPLSAPPVEPRPPRIEKQFPGELPMSFEQAAALLSTGHGSGGFTIGKLMVALGQPLLGALPHAPKRAIEQAVGDRRYFTAAGATGLNALHNFIIYPVALIIIGALLGRPVFSENLRYLIFLGVVLATVEAIWRMREGVRGLPPDHVTYRAAIYGLPLAPLASPVVRMVEARQQQGSVGQDGFRDPRFEEKLERERRYGEVYRLIEESNGYLLQLEFPRKVPPSGVREELGVPEEMPDYDYDIALQNGFLVVKGKVTDPTVRKIAAVSSAFPPDFTQNIKLPGRVAGFRHRFVDKSLEVALPRKV